MKAISDHNNRCGVFRTDYFIFQLHERDGWLRIVGFLKGDRMKAVIMAGGRGVRLQPISIGCPKPLIPVFDRPVMEHILDLLKRHGIREVRATLQYMPEKMIRYFEENPPEGIALSFSVEEKPLGTAGSVALCKEFVGSDDFLVISGDAVCDMNLSRCIEQHRVTGAEATILLYRHPRPLEYGLVMTREDGRIERFIEKPSWSQVFCDTVNTGIYILNPKVLQRVRPDISVDFAKDVFKEMLREGAPLYGTVADGYWCDIGGPEAYTDCHFDVLAGKAHIDIGSPRIDGCCVMSEISAGVRLHAPVYIGKNVRIGRNAEIGPYAVIGAGSVVGARTIMEYSVCNSAQVREGVEIRGAVLCKGAVIGRDTVISEGCVVGEGAEIEDSVTLAPRVKVWPGLHVRRGGTEKRCILTEHGGQGSLPFDENSDISGDLSEISPEVCLRIGAALGNEGTTAVGYAGGPVAETLAAALSCGIRSVGSDVIRHDGRFLAEASFAAELYGSEISAFVDGLGESIRIHITGKNRTPPSRETERKLNKAVRADYAPQNKERFGKERFAIGAGLAYEGSLWKAAEGKAQIRVAPDHLPGEILREILARKGCMDLSGRKACLLGTSADGTSLRVADENGHMLENETITALLALIHFREGNRSLALPFDAPQAIEILAQRLGTRIFRRGRDDEYDVCVKDSLFLSDAILAGIMLCNYLARTGKTVSELCGELPVFRVMTKNTFYTGDRGALMRSFSMIANQRELGDGIRFPLRNGWVHVAPSNSKPLIRIISESVSAEAAEELCVDIERMIQKGEEESQ